ncbi:GAF and ANTAR domain-containing protein [Micromonospora sp. STR1_7]|uniref:GAF and ANTAR domain-containing protein n=1 Tax=Micromonospora parastrephiae TaxID=2806101 RepID=A0ABS1Y2V2_9ACTN|nr:GAF and ANTAR domain-containing protein [Micromonospora parastrephiae]MBM0235795.1 GAF and ANTAR domain-containing protein [Micromonospora parastrephiae]
MTQPDLDPADALAELGRTRLDETSLDDMLRRIADLASRSVPGAREVSVTLVRGRAGWTAAFTGVLARHLDEWQYEQHRGPCLDASASGDTISVPDMVAEQRWPTWAAVARTAGAGSSLSIGLPIQESVVGALNVYGDSPNAFGPSAIAVAEGFAAYAAVALANAHLYNSAATLAEQMREAMRSRAVIEQAKGIIMGDRRCSPEEAFALLSKISQDTNRKVHDVAEALVARAVRSTRV